MISKSMIFGAMLALTAGPALAQAPNAVNIVGTVEKMDAASISVKNEAGAVETYALVAAPQYFQNKPATLADIKPNDFVASAAIRKEDGKLHSTELRIWPEAMRGVGEGQRPMNDAQKQTMTNATVTGAAIVNGSNNIKVKFQGGESELILDPGVPVTRMDSADKAVVKAGAKVRLQGVKEGDKASINRITVL